MTVLRPNAIGTTYCFIVDLDVTDIHQMVALYREKAHFHGAKLRLTGMPAYCQHYVPSISYQLLKLC